MTGQVALPYPTHRLEVELDRVSAAEKELLSHLREPPKLVDKCSCNPVPVGRLSRQTGGSFE